MKKFKVYLPESVGKPITIKADKFTVNGDMVEFHVEVGSAMKKVACVQISFVVAVCEI